jgi:hypothetical protein
VISVDGPGEINAAARGISGDAVLDKISKLLDDNGDSCPEVTVNTVVTEENIDALPLFASQIESVSPKINLALLPVMPIESGLSVLRDMTGGGGGGNRRFLDVFTKMVSAHPLTIHNFDCIMRHENLRKIQCYNQYFTIRFSPRGELFTCGAGIASQLRRTDGAFKKIFKKGGLKKAYTMITRALSHYAGKADFTCRNLCNCESWLDMLFLGMDTGYAPVILRGFKGRLKDDDYRELDKFVKKNINPKFDIDWFRGLVEGGNGS